MPVTIVAAVALVHVGYHPNFTTALPKCDQNYQLWLMERMHRSANFPGPDVETRNVQAVKDCRPRCHCRRPVLAGAAGHGGWLLQASSPL
ncbi:hypothetical protein KL86PLE_100562 [uncultured Pleomorphomonas sp.]|uniref:Uncharacterized protein n=1 Tax=uncultured Pleomorphomonas sp. TaxID=442121 RepID=A0A212L4F9_9HYPH|nr:hypothetical protein KL86PLE_100562 [uncultured Pleomorphomonas sp.]